jgi:hypothetical protein
MLLPDIRPRSGITPLFMNACSASDAPLTLSLSPSGGEGIETTPSPSARERVGVRVAQVFAHSPG